MTTLEDRLSQTLRMALSRFMGGAVTHRARHPAAAPQNEPPPQVDVDDRLVRWEIPKEPSFGDLSNSVAFKLAATQRQPPQRVAEELSVVFRSCARETGIDGCIDRMEAKAGFLNVFLSQPVLITILRTVRRQGRRYGTSRSTPHRAINIEFVSANPTGPLSVAHGRQAAVGDVLARLLRSQGHSVTTEFYLNDEGRQIDLLGRSLRARYLEQLGRHEPFPEDGYRGGYVIERAARLAQERRGSLVDAPESTFAKIGMEEILQGMRRDLRRFGLVFDRWSSQAWLRTSGRIDAALQALTNAGVLYESEDATWFASTRFGDDKDRVVRKRNGELTYLAPDIAYHRWKFQRGYDQVLNLWGPDHHGYIGRVRAAMAALGIPADRLMIRIVQLVTLSRNGKAIPMSKREGEFVTFREVLDEVGVDATRFFYLMRTMESHLDFNLDLAKSQSQENPVYYVQYAHARICSILAKSRLPWWTRWRPDLLRLVEPEERLLLRWLYQYPIVLRICAVSLEPHGVTTYLRRLAGSFHLFYTKHRVISDDRRLSAARLALVEAVRQVLANGLDILGITAPRRMEQPASPKLQATSCKPQREA